MREVQQGLPDAPAPSTAIIEQKYTVHQTKDSKFDSNCIHHTTAVDGRDPIETEHYTQAFKKFDRFALLFGDRLGSENKKLLAKKYNDSDLHLLDDLDEQSFTLFMAVFASNSSRKFSYEEQPDLKWHQWFGHDFSVLIVWSFILEPTYNARLLNHAITIPIEMWQGTDLEEICRPLIEGLEEKSCLELFRNMRSQSKDELINVLKQEFHDDPEMINMINFTSNLGYSRSGTRRKSE